MQPPSGGEFVMMMMMMQGDDLAQVHEEEEEEDPNTILEIPYPFSTLSWYNFFFPKSSRLNLFIYLFIFAPFFFSITNLVICSQTGDHPQ